MILCLIQQSPTVCHRVVRSFVLVENSAVVGIDGGLCGRLPPLGLWAPIVRIDFGDRVELAIPSESRSALSRGLIVLWSDLREWIASHGAIG